MSFFQTDDERRIFKRRPLRVAAQVLVANGKSVEVRTTDLSEGGLGVVAGVSPRHGTAFRIQFRLPMGEDGEYLVDTRVSVVRSVLARDETGFKIGLAFERLDRDTQEAIWRFMDRS